MALDYLDRYGALIDEGSPSYYKLSGWKRRRCSTEKSQLRRLELGQPHDGEHRTLLIVGDPVDAVEWIDGVVNHVVGVDWCDPFRFQLIKDADSFKSAAFTLHRSVGMTIDYTLTFVVTSVADFARTLHELEHVHCVCLVTSAESSPVFIDRLKRLLGHFDSGLSSNVKWIVSSHDACSPGEHQLPVGVVNFYNGIVYEDNTLGDYEDGWINVDYDQRLVNWRQQSKLFDSFLASVKEMESKSLEETRRISNAMKLIKDHLKELDLLLEECKIKMGSITSLDNKMKAIRDQVEAGSAYYTRPGIESKMMKKVLPNGTFTYSCINCNVSCERVDAAERSLIENKGSAFWRRCASKTCHCPGHRHVFKTVEIRRVSRSSPELLHDDQLKHEYDEKCKRLDGLGALSEGIRDELSAAESHLLRLVGEVSSHLGAIRAGSLLPAPEAAKSVLDLLDEAFDRCRTPLPSPAPSQCFDQRRVDYRDELIYRLKERALTSGAVASHAAQ